MVAIVNKLEVSWHLSADMRLGADSDDRGRSGEKNDGKQGRRRKWRRQGRGRRENEETQVEERWLCSSAAKVREKNKNYFALLQVIASDWAVCLSKTDSNTRVEVYIVASSHVWSADIAHFVCLS